MLLRHGTSETWREVMWPVKVIQVEQSFRCTVRCAWRCLRTVTDTGNSHCVNLLPVSPSLTLLSLLSSLLYFIYWFSSLTINNSLIPSLSAYDAQIPLAIDSFPLMTDFTKCVPLALRTSELYRHVVFSFIFIAFFCLLSFLSTVRHDAIRYDTICSMLRIH